MTERKLDLVDRVWLRWYRSTLALKRWWSRTRPGLGSAGLVVRDDD